MTSSDIDAGNIYHADHANPNSLATMRHHALIHAANILKPIVTESLLGLHELDMVSSRPGNDEFAISNTPQKSSEMKCYMDAKVLVYWGYLLMNMLVNMLVVFTPSCSFKFEVPLFSQQCFVKSLAIKSETLMMSILCSPKLELNVLL